VNPIYGRCLLTRALPERGIVRRISQEFDFPAGGTAILSGRQYGFTISRIDGCEMKPKKVFTLAGGIVPFVSVPEMLMGFQYFEGHISFSKKGTLPLKGLLLSTYYVVPIADSVFTGHFLREFQTDFFGPNGMTSEFCCIREDSQSGWTVVWEDAVPNLDCEAVQSTGSPASSQDQRRGFLTALAQAFPQQQALVPAPGTPRTLSQQTTGDEGFLRFTFQIPDRRVNSVTGDVAPGTYCSPFRDGQKITCGFEAVGRFALPVPLPYKHLVLLVPPIGTYVDVGTVVPNFGQAGGGVEGLFPNGFNNPNLHYHSLPAY
jgi:hypothetical protein